MLRKYLFVTCLIFVGIVSSLIVNNFALASEPSADKTLNQVGANQSATNHALYDCLITYFEHDIPVHESAFIDLNQDGYQDFILYARDPAWCGSGGCTLFVFKGQSTGYSFLSRTTLVDLPISVAKSKSNAWLDLIVYVKRYGWVVLKMGEQGYPLNPSMIEVATEEDMQGQKQILDYRF